MTERNVGRDWGSTKEGSGKTFRERWLELGIKGKVGVPQADTPVGDQGKENSWRRQPQKQRPGITIMPQPFLAFAVGTHYQSLPRNWAIDQAEKSVAKNDPPTLVFLLGPCWTLAETTCAARPPGLQLVPRFSWWSLCILCAGT